MSSMPVLGGRYRLLDRIGRGGMSVVWRGYDQVLGRTVAVKLLAGGDTGAAARVTIRAEARTAAQLSHPHICQVYDYGEAQMESGDHVPYIVMELLSGSTLMERLRAGPMPVREALRVCAQVASALAAAHGRGLVHRDVKPANIMMTPVGPKVVDFGIAATAGAPHEPVSAGHLQGTPAYLAPERLMDGVVTAASDVYALGLVLYRMVSGTVPWPAETLTEMLEAHQYREPASLPPVEGLPETVADLCQRCLAKAPGDRPTAQEVAQRLAEAIDEPEAAPTHPVALAAPPAPHPQRVVLQGIGRRLLAQAGGTGPHAARRHVTLTRHRQRLALLAVIGAAATVAGVAGGIWLALSPLDTHESEVAAPGEPSPGLPVTDPAGAGSPLAPTGSARPSGSGPGGDASPGVPGPEEPGSTSPGPVAPEPGPGRSEAPEDPDSNAAEEVVETPGGTVLARCDGSRASVEPLELAPGFRVVEETRGPGVVRAGIVLGSADSEVRVDVRCRAGQPVSTVQVD